MRACIIPILLSSCLAAFPVAAQARSPFSAKKLTPRADSFAILMQGAPRGFATETIERTPDGYRLTSKQELGTLLLQTTEVTFSRSLEMRSVKQTGKARGMQMKIEVTYAGGRAKGTATTPGPQGIMKTTVVDTVVSRQAVDDNLLMALLPTLTLKPGAEYKVEVFASGKGESNVFTLKVGAKESVDVMAGVFQAYPVQLIGGPVPVTFFVSADTSPRVVRMTIRGGPMEYQAVR